MVVADEPVCPIHGSSHIEYSVSTYHSVSRAVIGLEQRGLLNSKTQRGRFDYERNRDCLEYTHEKTVRLTDEALSVDWLAVLQASQHLKHLVREWSLDIELEDGCSSHLVFGALRVGLRILVNGISVDWSPNLDTSQHLAEAACV